LIVKRSNPRNSAAKPWHLPLGVGLLVVAVVVLIFTSGFVFQAFRGPRPITEKEMLELTDPGWSDNYVSYTPPRAFIDTGLQWGRKGNPGTKYVLLPVGDRFMLCSARIANNGPTFTGRLGSRSGVTEDEVVDRIKGSSPEVAARIMPIMLQAVRSIWFDTAVALALVLGLAGTGTWLVIWSLLARSRTAARGDSDE
jgi:hypothetical protein